MTGRSTKETIKKPTRKYHYSQAIGNEKDEFLRIYRTAVDNLQLPGDTYLLRNPDTFSYDVFVRSIKLPFSHKETDICDDFSQQTNAFTENKFDLQRKAIQNIKNKSDKITFESRRTRIDMPGTGKHHPGSTGSPYHQGPVKKKENDPYKFAEDFIKKIIDNANGFSLFTKQDKDGGNTKIYDHDFQQTGMKDCYISIQPNKPPTQSFETNKKKRLSSIAGVLQKPGITNDKKINHNYSIQNQRKQIDIGSSQELYLFISNTVNALHTLQSPFQDAGKEKKKNTPVIPIDGYREKGGRVAAGKNYIVGEKGPEILMMKNSPGSIVPNSRLGSTTAFTVVFENITITTGTGLNKTSIINQVKNALNNLAKTEFRAETGTIEV